MSSIRPQRPAAALLCAAATTLLLLAAPALAATVSGSKIEKALKPALTAQQHTTATSVSCPSKITIVAGGKFSCTARFSSGDKASGEGAVQGLHGPLRLGAENLLIKKLEKSLEASADKSGINSPDADCPASAGSRRATSSSATSSAAAAAVGRTPCARPAWAA